jgi:plastocyanin
MAHKRLMLVCIWCLVAVGCGSGSEPSSTTDSQTKAVEVTAANFAFTPILITVDAGQTVALTFTNEDDTQHSFTSDALGVDLVVDGGSSSSAEFDAPSGAAEFHCKFHPAMTGTVAPQGVDASTDPGAGDDSQDLDY